MDSTKKSRIIVIIAVIAAIAAGIYLLLPGFLETNLGKNRAISNLNEPEQVEITEKVVNKKIGGYDVDITCKYKYELDALVVSVNSYSGHGIQDKLSPRDIAVAWGDVAAMNTEIDFNWKHSNRFIYWNTDSADYTKILNLGIDVDKCYSNNHIIPANSSAKKALKHVHKGDRVRIKGYLVDVYASKSSGRYFYWNSSTSRTDTGDGACELIYADSIEIID